MNQLYNDTESVICKAEVHALLIAIREQTEQNKHMNKR
jgi:hypothetical protein